MQKYVITALLILGYLGLYAEEARLLRFPHVHGDQIVFSYAGDLYTANKAGGTARRLTSHIGYEMFPRFSPDGKFIAFTGQYDGNTEVFMIPSEGGEPKRLTYTATLKRDDLGDRMGPNNIVMDWTPDSKNILFRSRRYTFNNFTGQLFTISIDGGESVEIPLKNGGFSTYSPDGKKLAYNYIFREFRAWKRYQGGMADDIRVFDFESGKSEIITNHVRQDVSPMWSPDGKDIYFISDRNDIMNLFVYHTENKATEQLTHYTDYDIKFPSIGGEEIVYEYGGYIYLYNTKTKKDSRIKVSIENDQVYARPELKDVSSQIRNVDISPNGERLLLSARGDVFSVPAKEGITYNLTNSSNANDYNAQWSPDGKHIAYISDKSGEFHIWLRDMINGHEKQLTQEIKTYIFDFSWSPDSKKIAWSEKKNTFNITDIASGTTELIEESGYGPVKSFNWSPDSKYITYTRSGKIVNYVMVYDVQNKQYHQITDDWYDSSAPNFSKDGKYLLFVSARSFNPTYSRTEWNHVYTNMQKIYLLPLAKDAAIPFTPKNDVAKTEDVTATPKAAKEPKKEKSESKVNAIIYDFTDIENRIIELPVSASNYYGADMIDKHVYYYRGGQTFVYNIDNKTETGLDALVLFGSKYKKAIAKKGSAIKIIDIPTAKISMEKPVSLTGMKKNINYHEEWMQIYGESWRQMRDFFYAKNMHGVDWDGVYEKYKVLIPHVNHRTDLTYIIGEMIAELSVGHAYSENGEHPEPQRISMGLLGAQFEKDASGYFKVKNIIEGANWNHKTRSPLTMPGVDVKEGDYILAINGQSVKETDNLFKYMIDMAGKTVELEVNTTADTKGSRKVLVTPLAEEGDLYYYNWVQNNIRKVSEATNGEVGYIHIPDMGVAGLNEFVKHYYPQLNKKALIIDDRGNGGGNVSPMLTERLLRTPAFYTMHTNQTEGSVNPVGTFTGPKVLLINEYSASDGDLFPYRFKHYNLGTVIGKRSWGGTVGYSGTIPVVDGGAIVTPSYAPFAADGSGYIVEGEGVHPHINIANDPHKEFMGEDEQLNKAIEVILEKLKETQPKQPDIPAFPDKSGRK
ncbi:PDZ domain-containing protein [Odoribacter sp. OttesenSCG-928-J03]|nr:PDZ domain-containing protein [Odoribacter sp. OttesenSCG-928-J03]MDL2330546.1 PDZ domain-containing protein [Odoribacter sp. OttesenSCG-928-A06]